MVNEDPEWITVLAYENLPGCPAPAHAVADWLLDRGIDWLPCGLEDIHINLYCGRRADGHWRGTFQIQMRADQLRHLGLHPDQPWSRITGPERPGWARAEALRHM